MRVLIIADIHANRHALDAIEEPYDFCVCVGDLVDYGPDAKGCVDWVRENCRYAVRGNHDHGLAQNVDLTGQAGYRRLGGVTRSIGQRQIAEKDRQFLTSLPMSKYFRIDDTVFCMVHATPRDPLDEYVFADEQAWTKRVENLGADVLVVGHTHHQFQIQAGAVTVLNPGSVGQPRDGDPRAAYAIWEDGKIELKRVPYDVEATIAHLQTLQMPDTVQSFAERVLRHGGQKAAAEKNTATVTDEDGSRRDD
jgi:putative phosphoesterase